mmetsp:Transcript_54690/g.144506  ORF Transcript_54690/g.144506 Transcript_54690/m.144506 type:complete len:99 (+) Transcript_54690:56-352(+)
MAGLSAMCEGGCWWRMGGRDMERGSAGGFAVDQEKMLVLEGCQGGACWGPRGLRKWNGSSWSASSGIKALNGVRSGTPACSLRTGGCGVWLPNFDAPF